MRAHVGPLFLLLGRPGVRIDVCACPERLASIFSALARGFQLNSHRFFNFETRLLMYFECVLKSCLEDLLVFAWALSSPILERVQIACKSCPPCLKPI